MKTLHNVLDLIVPKRCAVCRRPLEDAGCFLCTVCESDMPLTYFWSMEENEMSRKLNAKVQELRDRDVESTYEPYIRASALFFYKGDYRELTKAVKYRADIQLGNYLGKVLGQKLEKSPVFEGIDAVVPVPLHWLRRLKRGYNQAEVIADALAVQLGAGIRNDILARRRNTLSQARISVEMKAENMSGAFAVEASAVEGASQLHHILLVDDVFTTGSTMAECCREIRKALPRVRISVATLAFVGE